MIEEAKYLGYGADKHDPTIKAHLFQTKINKTSSWIIVREMEEECRVHSISDNADIVDFVIKRKGRKQGISWNCNPRPYAFALSNVSNANIQTKTKQPTTRNKKFSLNAKKQ